MGVKSVTQHGKFVCVEVPNLLVFTLYIYIDSLHLFYPQNQAPSFQALGIKSCKGYLPLFFFSKLVKIKVTWALFHRGNTMGQTA